ncbi:MAG: RNA polymerase sigma-54 factor, partial [Gemmatimonadota bacterium]|nr:RNA polymerase sigma-54 factor [Gemmatimonadota bacterium]
EGEYVVSLFDGSVPRLRISRKYQEILRRGTPRETASANGKPKPEGDSRRKEEVDFVQQKLQSASWLIQTIEQRRRTMIRVMEAIVEVQRDFFEKGPGAMRPLTLQNVADRIEMHESTVSRVTTNKYVQTNRGVLPLKHFFSSGLETESGDSVSSKMAQERIRDLIEGENKQKPLSDQRIANLLREDGVIVARRTVAKYREKMGLLTARLRKEY